MGTRIRNSGIRRWGVGIGLVWLALSLLGSADLLAAPMALPPRPTPLPSLPPTAVLSAVGRIVLEGEGDLSAWPELWTGVEWQDGEGAWHPVEGWFGPLDTVTATGGEKVWSVLPDHFGQGPFRWVLYAQRDGRRLVESAAFELPGQAQETVRVQVALMPPLLPTSGRIGAIGGWLTQRKAFR